MSNTHAELVRQLNVLLRLTAIEAATARSRVAQATTDATARELTRNAEKGDERATALRSAISGIGGVADLLGVAVAKTAAVGKLPLEQTLPVTEALLADLALEHQLLDRTRLVKVLAHEADERTVVRLAERLEKAHTETVGWLTTVLAETAVGGPAALAPTSAQAAAATARSTVTYAGSVAAKTVNRTAAAVGGLTERVQSGASSALDGQLDRVKTLARSATAVFTAGRDAGLSTAESEAGKKGADGTADSVRKVREGLGATGGDELPVPGLDQMSSKQAADAVQKLERAEQVRTVLAHEKAHKNRPAVTSAGEKRVRDIASELVSS